VRRRRQRSRRRARGLARIGGGRARGDRRGDASQDWAAGSAFTSTRPHHWRVDLYALARQRLAAVGVAPGRVHGGNLCTIAEPQRFYSHRRDRRTGRMATVAWLSD